MKTCLVTGATGFVGRRLVSQLAELESDVSVIGAGRCECIGPCDRFIEVDLGQEGAKVDLSGVDTVFHLASKAHAVSERPGDDSGYRAIIVEGTRRIVAAAEAAGVQSFVYMSSVKAMGEGESAHASQPIDETMSPEPKTPYGCCKLEAEAIVLESSIPHVVVLRPVMVYGAGHKGNLVRMAGAIRAGRFPPVAENGNRRSMVHIKDLVNASIRAADQSERTNRQVYILAGKQALSTRELYDALREELLIPAISWSFPTVGLRLAARVGDVLGAISGRRMPLDSDTLSKLIGSAWYSSAKCQQDLGVEFSTQNRFLEK